MDILSDIRVKRTIIIALVTEQIGVSGNTLNLHPTGTWLKYKLNNHLSCQVSVVFISRQMSGQFLQTGNNNLLNPFILTIHDHLLTSFNNIQPL
jgi:hypothetical protein